MSQLHFYVPDEVEKQLRDKAQAANLPLSRFLAEVVKREISQPVRWPEGYFEQVFGQWQGEPLIRAPQGGYEQRPDLD